MGGWWFTTSSKIKRQLLISRELFSPVNLLIIISLSGAPLLSRFAGTEGRFISSEVAPAGLGLFHIGNLKRTQNVLMVLFCSSFVTADYSNGRAHVERPARTLISLSKPDSPKILLHNKIRDAFWICLRSQPSNQRDESGVFCRWQVIKTSIIIITLWFLFLCGGGDGSFRK